MRILREGVPSQSTVMEEGGISSMLEPKRFSLETLTWTSIFNKLQSISHCSVIELRVLERRRSSNHRKVSGK